MADNEWALNLVNGLNDVQKQQLSQALRNCKTAQEQSSGFHNTADGSTHFFPSRSPTLQASARTSLRSTSAHSYDTISLDSVPYPAARNEGAIERIGNARNHDSSSRPPSRIRHLRQGDADHIAAAPYPSSHTEQPVRSKPKPFFCTYCHELGIPTSFGLKSDWKRHEQTYHETGEEWLCQVDGCEEVFCTEERFRAHSDKEHGHLPAPRGIRVSLPDGRVWSCGFATCRQLTYSWKERCDHVATCMSQAAREHRKDWSYTTRFLNLLRQRRVEPTWKRVRSRWLTQLHVDKSQLQWDSTSSRSMRRELEYRTFDSQNLEAFLEMVLRLGLRRPAPPRSVSNHPWPGSPTVVAPRSVSAPAIELQPAETLYSTIFSSDFEKSWNLVDNPLAGPSHFESGAGVSVADSAKTDDVAMMDAPGLNESEAGITQPGQLATEPGQDYMLWTEALFPGGYSPSTSAPFPESSPGFADTLGPDTSRLYPGQSLMRRSREWLCERRGPQFQPKPATDNIDPALTLEGTIPSSDAQGSTNPADTHVDNLGDSHM